MDGWFDGTAVRRDAVLGGVVHAILVETRGMRRNNMRPRQIRTFLSDPQHGLERDRERKRKGCRSERIKYPRRWWQFKVRRYDRSGGGKWVVSWRDVNRDRTSDTTRWTGKGAIQCNVRCEVQGAWLTFGAESVRHS